MMVMVNPEHLLELVPACPEWCIWDRDHDVDQIAKGARCRIHWSPSFDGSASVLVDDDPEVSESKWYFEPPEVQLYGATADELAGEIRRHVAVLTRTIEWLEGQA